MAKVWLQLRTSKHIETQGKVHQFNAGDWVAVGKQTAIQWLAAGDAWNFRLGQIVPPGCGIVARGGVSQGEGDYLGVPVSTRIGTLPYPRTLMWDSTKLALRTNILPIGFSLLTNWQVVAPLWSYDDLACHISTEEDRALTQEVIRDLRVPVFDIRMIFLKRCADTIQLVKKWEEEKKRLNGDDKLAFMRAIYAIKTLVCAQPTSWTRGTN